MLSHAVFGSANINDRSMLGHRNSEMAFYLKDTKIYDVCREWIFYLSDFHFCVVIYSLSPLFCILNVIVHARIFV